MNQRPMTNEFGTALLCIVGVPVVTMCGLYLITLLGIDAVRLFHWIVGG